MQMVIEIPEELKGVGEAVQTMVRQVEATWRSTRGGRAVEYAAIEQQLAAGAAAIYQRFVDEGGGSTDFSGIIRFLRGT